MTFDESSVVESVIDKTLEESFESIESPSGFQNEEPLELLVIGAGPHALSLLTRLIDQDADLLTEVERGWIMKKATRFRSYNEIAKHLKKRFDRPTNTVVIDGHGEWLAQWKADFAAFGIEWLRSHEHLHPDPYDWQSLKVYAHQKKRHTTDLKQMQHIDRDACRKQGYYGPFVVPSTSLYLDFCADLVDRYGLGGDMVQKGWVQQVRTIKNKARTIRGTIDEIMGATSVKKPLFEVILSDGRRYLAKRVVCALGPGPAFQGMRATLPWWAEELEESLKTAEEVERLAKIQKEEQRKEEVLFSDKAVAISNNTTMKREKEEVATSKSVPVYPVYTNPTSRLQHSCNLSTWLRSRLRSDENIGDVESEKSDPVRQQISGKKILVVGGGQTSAHLAQVALSKLGAGKVTLLSRKTIMTKPYDVDIGYVGDRRPHFLEKFWEIKDFRKRKTFNANLRKGGSMTPDIYAELRTRMEKSSSQTEPKNDSPLAKKRVNNNGKKKRNIGKYARSQFLAELKTEQAKLKVAEPDEVENKNDIEVENSQGESFIETASTTTTDSPIETLVDDSSVEDVSVESSSVEGVPLLADNSPSRAINHPSPSIIGVEEGPLEGSAQSQSGLESTGLVTGEEDVSGAGPHQGELELLEETEVAQAHYCTETKTIQILFQSETHCLSTEVDYNKQNANFLRLEKFDFVWLATGGAFDSELIPIFKNLQKEHPIGMTDGLPNLQKDLSWSKDLSNLYVMGAFAQLQLGADALNLAGARSGGVTVAKALLKDFSNSLESNKTDGTKQLLTKTEKTEKRLAKRKMMKAVISANQTTSSQTGDHAGFVTESGEWKIKKCNNC